MNTNRSGWYARFALVALVLTYCVHWLDLSLVGKVAPAIAMSFDAPLQAMTLVFTGSRVGMALGAILGGIAGDRWGRKRVLCACLGLASLVSLASPLVGNLIQFSILRAISGLLLGGAAPCALALVASIAPQQWRSVAITTTLAGATVGSTLASLMAYLMIGPDDWRTGFFVCGGALLMTLALTIRWVPATVISSDAHKEASVRDLFGVMRTTTWVICAAFLLSMGLNALLASWLPSFFHALADIPVQRFAGIAIFTTPAAIVGMLVAGGLALRISSRLLAVIGFICYAGTLALLGTLSFGSVGFVISLAAVSCTQALCHGLLNLVVVSYYPIESRATALGCAVAAGRLGGIVAPVLGALALEAQISLQTLFVLLATVPVFVGVLLWIHQPTGNRL